MSTVLIAEETSRQVAVSKDDLVRLMHLYKEPSAQVHWTNFFGVLNRDQLDARKSSTPSLTKSRGSLSDAANPGDCLASIFNDYVAFKPQNLMVMYVYDASLRRPVKKQPFEPSSDDWEMLANHCHDLDPTNLTRKSILRDGDWIKSTWNDLRRWLHHIFTTYHRSGQMDADKGDWCSLEEQERWARTSQKKFDRTVRYPTVMMYSISVLDPSDFEDMGRAMPEGTGHDNSFGDAVTLTSGNRKRKKKASPSKSKRDPLSEVLREEGKSEQLRKNLEFLMKYGTRDDKEKALKQMRKITWKEQTDFEVNQDSADSEESARSVSDQSSDED